MAFGHHLRAHQHIHLTLVDLSQLSHQFTFEAGAVRVDARHPQGRTVWALHVRQQLGQQLFHFFRAVAHHAYILVAATGASTRHALGEAAVVAAQGAVAFVKHPVSAAMRAFAFPAAFSAMQYRRIAAPIQQHQHLLLPTQSLAHGAE